MSPLPPGPQNRFFGLSLIQEMRRTPLSFATRMAKTYGDLTFLRLGPVPVCIVNHPDLIREILISRSREFRKVPRTLDVLRQVDGEGLVISEGEFWLRQRRLLQPAFQPRRMAGYADAMIERIGMFLDRWQPGQTVEMVDEMTFLTMEIIAGVFFGVDVAGQTASLREAMSTMSEIFMKELSQAIPLPEWMPLPSKRRKQRAIATVHNLIDSMIRERRRSGEDRGDLLSMLLLAVDEEGDGKGMSDRQARDEAVTMFNAGHDTTAAVLPWAWVLLAKHPEIEARLAEEVWQVFQERPATADDLPKLCFTEAVVRETLRLYPSAWILFGRYNPEPIELGGYRFPRKTEFLIFPWVTHRDGRFFPEPERFDPDRFLGEREKQIQPLTWIPFGAGPHLCIGRDFAVAEMKLILALTLQRYRLRFATGQTPDPELVATLAIRPKGGMRMRVEAAPT